MIDDDKVVPAHVAIVSPRGEVLNKDSAPKKRPRPPGDFMKSYVTREEVVEHMTTAAVEVGEKMYEQFSGESAEYLEQMERDIFERVMREVEARSWRGLLRRAWYRIRPPVPELVEATTAAVEAMDPNVVKAVE